MHLPLKFVHTRIEEYAMQVTYDPREGGGLVVYNLSFVQNGDLDAAITVMRDTFRAGLCVSGLVRFVGEGGTAGETKVPAGHTGIITICSSTLDGILLRRGIPSNPIGGGVVEIEGRIPRRFIHLILYEHTTIDPLQALLSQEITSVTGMMRRGSGNILANIRQCHMEAEGQIGEVIDDLAGSSFSPILDVGLPNTPALGVTVDPQYMGIVALGGTNPMAAIKERGIAVTTHAIKGLMDVRDLEEILDY
ncbi:MAG TPA: DUF128 domain-containing protein [Methanolinea sp.]|jgi:repressor of nif and glnA expression|nr:DUF128 domain-containing protein [Methanolinea sp.]HPC55945.1 DUF128 domain-containing protein [Methanolinea sp.]HQE85473.1 DUF128 domain-containing protein [Methanolinea sp.]HQI14732.1 DUF128 domain-containing protein [Methanolinea sp.]HQJ19459.1 DUF128 domain-containing protein [Methanolinea sp.]